MRSRWALVAAGAVALACAQGLAFAQPQGTPPAASPERHDVELTIVGAADDELTDTIRELLGRLGVRLVAARASAVGELARVQVVLDATGEAHVTVYDPESSRVILRRAIPKNASVSIFRDEIAHAVDEAVQSELLADQDQVPPAGPPPPSPVESPNPPPVAAGPAPTTSSPPSLLPETAPAVGPPPSQPTPERDTGAAHVRAPSGLALDVTTLAGAGPFADRSPIVARVEGGVSLALRRWLRPSMSLSVAYVVPFGASSTSVDYRANVLSLRAMPAILPVRSAHFGLGVAAGLGVDVLTVAPGNGGGLPIGLSPATTRGDPVVSAAVTGHWGVAAGVALSVIAVCDFDLADRRYYDVIDGARTDVLVPWRVRPMLVAGFTFTALGEGIFAARGGR